MTIIDIRRRQEEIYEALNRKYEATKNDVEPFTFWLTQQTNNEFQCRFNKGNENKPNSYTSIGIVKIATRSYVQFIAFSCDSHFNVFKLQVDNRQNDEDISYFIKNAEKYYGVKLSKEQVIDFINNAPKQRELDLSGKTDYQIADELYICYKEVFEAIKSYDKKNKTSFYKIMKILNSEFENKREKSNKKMAETLNKIKNNLYLNPSLSPSKQIINQDNVLPLNLILYGPPGTGKTYHTVNKALEILLSEQERNQIFGESDLEKVDRKKLLEKFKELKDRGRIVFTTFHQSISYEDFIEGIKPITSDDGKVTYEVKPGIFKQICERANLLAQNNFQDAWGNFKNDLKTQREIVIKPPKGRTFNRFKIELCQNNTSVRDINDHSKTLNYNRAYEVYTGGTVYYQSYYEGLLELLKEKYNLKDYKAPVDNSEETSNKQEMEQDSESYVLIIDEINRGNVANIFGELITLIEEDKRLTPGKTNIYTVELPYSNEEFGVPSNLYIIGTMNTADRSVEALDTALRRRFSFEEMMPKPELLENRIVNVDNHDYDLSKLLNIINKRLEVLKDREHQIGHSYFMKVVTEAQLTSVFFDKIIPLLQEYFYGDYEKILMVLGKGFVEEKSPENIFAGNKTYDGLPEKVYYIANFNRNEPEKFDLSYALKKLMNIDEKKDETTTITTSENV